MYSEMWKSASEDSVNPPSAEHDGFRRDIVFFRYLFDQQD